MSQETVQSLENLILKAQKGDQEAFGLLYEESYTPIYKYLLSRTRDVALAQDLSQEVFIKVYKALGSFTQKNISPLAYFFTIARNTLIDYARKKKPLLVDEETWLEMKDEKEKTDRLAIQNEESKLLFKNLNMLPDDQRDVLIMRFINDFSYQEIAGILNKKEEAVRQLQTRGLKKLRSIYKEYETEK